MPIRSFAYRGLSSGDDLIQVEADETGTLYTVSITHHPISSAKEISSIVLDYGDYCTFIEMAKAFIR